MSSLSVGAAAFSGFSIIRHRPWLLLVWAALFLGAIIVVGMITGVLGLIFGAASLAGLSTNASPDPAQVAKMFLPLIPVYLIMVLLMAFVTSTFTTAVYRSVIEPAAVGFAYIQVGADELRQFAASLAIGVPMTVVYIVVGVIFGLLGAAIGAATVPAIGALITIAGIFSVMIFLMVRFSLAGPQTFGEHKLNLTGTWSLTRGHFWKIFAAYVVPGVVMFGVFLLVFVIVIAIVAATVGLGAMQNLQNLESNPAALAGAALGMLGFILLFYFIVYPLLMALTMTVLSAPPASVYKQLAQRGPEEVF